MTSRLVAKAGGIAAKKDVPVWQHLTLMMLALKMDSELGCEIMEQVHKPQNALMHQKMQDQLRSEISPLMTVLIKEGIAQGICQTDYPAEVAEMALLYSNTVFDALAVHGEEERKITAFIYNLGRLLGMAYGSMQAVILPIFQNGDK